MLTIAYYLLKVMICSGILYGYYLMALRNKAFHRWNRFYMLLSVCLSLLLPLIRINITHSINTDAPQVFQILQVVNSGDLFVENFNTTQSPVVFDFTWMIASLYAFISALILSVLIFALIKIQILKSRYAPTFIEGIRFRNTNAEGTPFSFFKNIFWNQEIDINSASGKQIFQHEIVHVRELHSHDKMFINLVLVLFWYNPFFWLMRKELSMIHEFIADKRALEDGDSSEFAAMILQATYPTQQFMITNNFFYSPLKRRLTMLTKNQNPRLGYIGRLLVLPIAAIIFFAFTLKLKPQIAEIFYEGRKITVIIDAGHGGADIGTSYNGVNEKDLTLAIAKKVKELNNNANLNIILTREGNDLLMPIDRVDFARANKADLLVSIHIDAKGSEIKRNGLDILIQKGDNSFQNKSKRLGSLMIQSFNSNYALPIAQELVQREKGVAILAQSPCPAILIEAGVLFNPQDLDFLVNSKNQEIIAQNILYGIEKYLQPVSSTQVEEIKAPADLATSKLQPIKAERRDSVPESPVKFDKNFLVIKDGVELGYGEKVVAEINPQAISSINVLKGETAIKKYGSKAKDGVIEIISKPVRDSSIRNDKATAILVNEQQPVDNMIFTQVEHPAEFGSGEQEWPRYLQNILQKNPGVLDAPESRGVYMVKFIVDKSGVARNVEVLTMKNSKLSEIISGAITDAKWKPGVQNGHIVTSYKTISITNK